VQSGTFPAKTPQEKLAQENVKNGFTQKCTIKRDILFFKNILVKTQTTSKKLLYINFIKPALFQRNSITRFWLR
jgi:hypothetical protein